jgi:outer membrane protein OmpU
MNNYKKIGLTALAASLVSVSAHAGAVSVTGSASMNTEGHSSSGAMLNAGTTFSMANSIMFTGSGELDNGLTASISFELDQGAANNSGNNFDNHSVSISSDSLGTLTLAGHGGSTAASKIDTTAAGDMWDNFDEMSIGTATSLDAVAMSSAGDDSFFYTSPDLMDGLNVTLSYNPQGTATASGNGEKPSETGYGINYTGVEGLSVSYASTDIETNTASTSGDNEVLKVSYVYGPVTATYSNSETDIESDTSSGETDSYALSYTISDELSVTYGSETHEEDGKATDVEVDGFSVAYTTGGMTISAVMQSAENLNHETGSQYDMDYWKLGASFAF